MKNEEWQDPEQPGDELLPALAAAIVEAEQAIEAVSKATSDRKVGLIVTAIDAVADVSDGLHREALGGLLAKAAHGIISKKTIIDGINARVEAQAQEKAEYERRLEFAALGPVDGADVAAEIVTFLRQYFVLGEHYFDILAIWTMHTHVYDSFDYTPYLTIISPTKRCGKSNLLTALGLLVARPWRTHSTSVASLARKIEKERCTMLLDESDAAFKGPAEYTDALRGVLNAGFEREGIYSRCVGDGTTMESKDFRVFCPKALAGIKKLPDTVTDRAVPIQVARKTKEQVSRFRSRRVKPEGAVIKKQIKVWADSVCAAIGHCEPVVIEEINDRAWDVCEPLMAIAESIGGGWDVKLKGALLKVFGAESVEDDDYGVQLLRDIKDVIGEQDRIFSADLITGLKSIETSPWSDWNGGKGLSTNALGRLLRAFGISPRSIRESSKTSKGYLRESFEDVWGRYICVPPLSQSFQNGTASQLNKDAELESVSEASQNSDVTLPKSASEPHKQSIVTHVPFQNAPQGDVDTYTGSKTPEDPGPTPYCYVHRADAEWRQLPDGSPVCARCHPLPEEENQ